MYVGVKNKNYNTKLEKLHRIEDKILSHYGITPESDNLTCFKCGEEKLGFFIAENKNIDINDKRKRGYLKCKCWSCNFILPRRTTWIFGLKLKNLEEIEEMIVNNKKLIQISRTDKYASLKISFKEIEETSYKKIFPVADLTKKSQIEEVIDGQEEFPF